MDILYMLLTLLCALLGGLALQRLKAPGGMMVGAVIGAGILNILTGQASMHPLAKTAAQIAAGAFIGVGVKREDLKQMRALFKIALVVIFGLLVVNVVTGLIICAISPLDPLTAFMSCAPGGLSDIPMIAAEMGADASQVLALQFVRFLLGIAVFPAAISHVHQDDANATQHDYKAPEGDWPHTLLTLAVSAVFGFLGKASGMPGGTMAFSTLGTIFFKLSYPKACILRPVRRAAQWLSGAFVGAGIGAAQIIALKHLALPAVVLVACYSLACVLLGRLLQKFKFFDKRESYLAVTPAGASDMALISADLGVYNVRLVLLQVMRLVAVITLFPTILNAISQWLI
jgi:membrane AbrB-like protein